MWLFEYIARALIQHVFLIWTFFLFIYLFTHWELIESKRWLFKIFKVKYLKFLRKKAIWFWDFLTSVFSFYTEICFGKLRRLTFLVKILTDFFLRNFGGEICLKKFFTSLWKETEIKHFFTGNNSSTWQKWQSRKKFPKNLFKKSDTLFKILSTWSTFI